MKVFIVGGYGGFGKRLARLLLGDGAQVSVAGRDLRQARAFTCRYGGEALQLDVNDVWRQCTGWSEPKRRKLGPRPRRHGPTL